MPAIPVSLIPIFTILMLAASNVFMTFAWYGHLKYKAAPLIVVLGHADFYSRFGFEISTDHGIESPFPVPPEVFRIQRLTHYRDEYRGLVQYPAAFQGL